MFDEEFWVIIPLNFFFTIKRKIILEMKHNPCRLCFILKFLTDAYTCFNILGKQKNINNIHSNRGNPG